MLISKQKYKMRTILTSLNSYNLQLFASKIQVNIIISNTIKRIHGMQEVGRAIKEITIKALLNISYLLLKNSIKVLFDLLFIFYFFQLPII